MVTGWFRPTSMNNLPILAEKKKKQRIFRRKRATIALASLTKEPNHLLHKRLHFRLTEQQSYLKSFVSAVLELLQDIPVQNAPANQWLDYK